MTAIKDIKKSARSSLDNHWASTVAVFCVLLLTVMLIAVAEAVVRYVFDIPVILDGAYNASQDSLFVLCGSLLLWFLIVSPVKLSLKGYYCDLIMGKDVSVSMSFDAFLSIRGYFASLILPVKLTFLRALTVIFFILPQTALLIFSAYYSSGELSGQEKTIITAFFVISGLLILAGLFIAISVNLGYFLAPYLLITNRAANVKQALKTSAKLMKKRKLALVRLTLSMLWMYILCLPLFSVIFVFPHMSVIKAGFAMEIINNQPA